MKALKKKSVFKTRQALGEICDLVYFQGLHVRRIDADRHNHCSIYTEIYKARAHLLSKEEE